MRLTVSLLIATGLVACQSPTARNAPAVIRDSAGITIVENRAPVRSVAAAIDSLPFVDIGGIGDAHAEFPGPVHSAFRLGDGRIVLAAWATTEVRIFDSTGRWIRNLGRSGSGPGEFEALGWVHRGPGDTLITYEPTNRRVSVFDAAGRFQRLVSLQPMSSSQFPRLQGATARGLLATAQAFQGEFPDLGLVRLRSALYRFSPDGQVTDSLVELPPIERISVRGGGSWSRPFDQSNSIAVRSQGFVVGHTARYELAYYGADDRLELLARRPVAPMDVSHGEYESAVDSLAAGMSATARERFRSILRAAPPTATRPVFAAVLPAPDGGVWVRGYDDPLHQSRQVSQFDGRGRWVGDVTLPAGLFPLQVGSDFVLGTWQDADEVTHVRLHRLRPVAP
jgi:hypothetical protein